MSLRHGLEIRSAAPADAPGLAQLFADAGCAVPAARMGARLEAALRGLGAVLVAMEWGPPSGVIALHWHASLASDHMLAEVSTLLVAGDARRRGLARLLLKAGAQAARSAGCHELALSVHSEPGLAAFCEQNGFAQDGMRLRRNLRRGGVAFGST